METIERIKKELPTFSNWTTVGDICKGHGKIIATETIYENQGIAAAIEIRMHKVRLADSRIFFFLEGATAQGDDCVFTLTRFSESKNAIKIFRILKYMGVYSSILREHFSKIKSNYENAISKLQEARDGE